MTVRSNKTEASANYWQTGPELRRKTMNKLATLSEAVAAYVKDGCHLALGGFVTNRKPYAAVREILRQGARDLLLNGGPAGGDVDLLLGAGRVRAYLNYYIANSGYSNVCRMFRLAVEHPELTDHYRERRLPVEDYSLDIYSQSMHAAAIGLPFLPTRYLLGSDLAAKWGIGREERIRLGLPADKLRIEDDPFRPGQKVALLPLDPPDVSIIHAQKASPSGLIRIEGGVFSDLDVAMAARNCIVTCEEIVSDRELRRDPAANSLPGLCVDAVVHCPWGAHPCQVYNYYDYDRSYLRDYDRASRSQADFNAYLEQWVYGLDHEAYLDKVGREHLEKLKVHEGVGYVPSPEEVQL